MEMIENLPGYYVISKLDKGEFSTLYLIHCGRCKDMEVLKFISSDHLTEERSARVRRELDVARIVHHRHITKFLHTMVTPHFTALLMEYVEGGSLLKLVECRGPVAVPVAVTWQHQLLTAITYLHHTLHIAHRDVSCANILLTSKNNVKLADFGYVTRDVFGLSDTFCGTRSHASVEIVLGQPYYPHKADVWSCGVVLYMMLFGELPFNICSYPAFLSSIQSPITFPHARSKGMWERLKQLLCDHVLVVEGSRLDSREFLREIDKIRTANASALELGMSPSQPRPTLLGEAVSTVLENMGDDDGDATCNLHSRSSPVAPMTGLLAASSLAAPILPTSPLVTPILPIPPLVTPILPTSPLVTPILPTPPPVAPVLPTEPPVAPILPTEPPVAPISPLVTPIPSLVAPSSAQCELVISKGKTEGRSKIGTCRTTKSISEGYYRAVSKSSAIKSMESRPKLSRPADNRPRPVKASLPPSQAYHSNMGTYSIRPQAKTTGVCPGATTSVPPAKSSRPQGVPIPVKKVALKSRLPTPSKVRTRKPLAQVNTTQK